MMDKQHFNTYELLHHSDSEFYNQGHNRIFQYFLMIFVFLFLSKFFIFISRKNIIKYYALIFVIVLTVQVINSYLIFLLNNNSNFYYYYYYLINFFVLNFFSYIILKFNENY